MKQIYRATIALFLCVCMALSLASCGSGNNIQTTEPLVTIDDVKKAPYKGYSKPYAEVLESMANDTYVSTGERTGYEFTWTLGFTGPCAPDDKLYSKEEAVTLQWDGNKEFGTMYMYFGYSSLGSLRLLDVANSSDSVVNGNLSTYENLLVDILYNTYG